MLFEYENKVYIKPFKEKIVEVKVTKKGDEYNVEPLNKTVIITPKISEKIHSITIEKAYKLQSRGLIDKEV